MKVAIIAPNDLRIFDGTTIRITGFTKALSHCVERVYLISTSTNYEISKLNNVFWIRLKYSKSIDSVRHRKVDVIES